MKFAIYGAGGFGREVAQIAEQMLLRQGSAAAVVFISDQATDEVNGRPVVDLSALKAADEVVIALADAATRMALAARCQALGLRFGSIIAPTHLRYDDVQVGHGSIFCANTIVTSNVRIGAHFHCNLNSYVAHDCEIGDFVTFAPNVCCNGRVTIGDGAYLGTGAMIRPGVTIGRNAIVGMGAVVVRDVPEGATVVGNPARVPKG